MNFKYCLFSNYRNFVQICSEALSLNFSLINQDQVDYHDSLVKNFNEMVARLEDIFGEKVSRIIFLLMRVCPMSVHLAGLRDVNDKNPSIFYYVEHWLISCHVTPYSSHLFLITWQFLLLSVQLKN